MRSTRILHKGNPKPSDPKTSWSWVAASGIIFGPSFHMFSVQIWKPQNFRMCAVPRLIWTLFLKRNTFYANVDFCSNFEKCLVLIHSSRRQKKRLLLRKGKYSCYLLACTVLDLVMWFVRYCWWVWLPIWLMQCCCTPEIPTILSCQENSKPFNTSSYFKN